MPKLNIEDVKQKVYKNSLETCEYLDGFENTSSVIRVQCIKHGNVFKTKYENLRRDNRAHHVCPQCQEEDRLLAREKDATWVECAYCGKKFLKPNSKLNCSKSGLYFCCREHKDLAQSLESGEKFSEMRPEHYGKSGSEYGNISNYRIFALRHYPNSCAICGYDEDVDLLEVHHIDEDRTNNLLDNLIPLCPICHKKLTSHKYKLIDRTQIIKNVE